MESRWLQSSLNFLPSIVLCTAFFPILFPRVIILVGSTSNAVADFSSPWNMKGFVTLCPIPLKIFPSANLAECISIRGCNLFTLKS